MTDGERAQLAERHLDLAHRAARLVHARVRAHADLAELTAVASAALVEAARRFDPTRGAAFPAFAWYRVHGAVIDSVRRSAVLPRRTWSKLLALRAAAELLEHAAERDAGTTSAPQRTRADALRALEDAMATIRTVYVVSLATLDESAEPASPATNAHEQLATAALARRLRAALATLPDRERALVERHYFEGIRLDEAGAAIGISKSWASRLHARAIERLRAALADDG